MISLVLIGIQLCEPAELGGEPGPFSDVAIDGHGVAGPGVGPGQCLAARGSELDKAGGNQLGGRDDLHVAELPDVIVLPVQRAPADEDVGGALDQPLAADHPRAVTPVAAGAGMGLVHRRSGLLDLKEQRVGAGAALKQHQVDLHPHAAHPDHLTHHVDHREPVEQALPVLLKRQPVLGQEALDDVRLLVVADRDADRRVLGDAGAPVHQGGELGERPAAGATVPFSLDIDGDQAAVGWLKVADQAVDAHAVVPDVELWHRPVPAHAPAIGLHGRGYRGAGHCRRDLVLARRHDEAGGKALDIPFEGAGKGFVEVAHIEQQVPLRRGPQAEVQDVGVTAQLDDQPAVGLGREVAGHDRRGAPVVGPRGGRHAVMADGNELGNAGLVLGHDRGQRVLPAFARFPVPQRAPPDPFPRGLPVGAPVIDRGGQVARRGARGRRPGRAGSGHGTLMPECDRLDAPRRGGS